MTTLKTTIALALALLAGGAAALPASAQGGPGPDRREDRRDRWF